MCCFGHSVQDDTTAAANGLGQAEEGAETKGGKRSDDYDECAVDDAGGNRGAWGDVLGRLDDVA
jgi:hypothetical protein